MFEELTNKIQQEAQKLLKSNKADLIIGYAKGSLPYRTQPIIIEQEKDINKLVWNSFCTVNLARFALKFADKKIGIIAKGCDTRSLVSLIIERKLKRENIIIIGVSCPGMIGLSDVKKRFNLDFIEEIKDTPDKIIISGREKTGEFKREEMVNVSCKDCRYPNPVISDILTGPEIKIKGDRFKKVKEFEKLSPKEKAEYFQKEFSKCIRCYACREVCPLCYCKQCFTESSKPKWIDKGAEKTDKSMYLIIREMHMIGRCSDCGACARICPAGVDLNLLMNKIASDLLDNYNFEAGVKPDEKEPLVTFREDDLNNFIL